MALTLYNPTNEELKAVYAGVTFIIPPEPKEGHMVRVDDNKGNHILNQLGPRGLTSLDFGDEGKIKKKKAEEGRKRNKDFKRKQVIRYNQDNEARKATQRQYVNPPDQIKEYAKELGIALIAPYEVVDVKNEEIAELRKQREKDENEKTELRNQVSELMNTVQNLIGKIEEFQKTPEQIRKEEEQKKIDEMISSYKSMNRHVFRPTVENLGIEEYKKLPVPVQQFINQRWEGFFNKDEAPFPY